MRDLEWVSVGRVCECGVMEEDFRMLVEESMIDRSIDRQIGKGGKADRKLLLRSIRHQHEAPFDLSVFHGKGSGFVDTKYLSAARGCEQQKR